MTRIKNEKALTDRFGRWPSFHDAEIISIHLDRSGQDGPTLEAKIHVFEMTSRVDAKGHYVLKNHTLVTFRFSRILMGEIKWFNHQNVMAGLNIEKIEPEEHGFSFNVSIESIFGCEAAFRCQEIIIADVVPFEPEA
jgi:Immunity protein 50